MESGESLIGTNERVVKARDFRRKAEKGGRWSVVDFDKFVGVPWEPYPGAKGGFELRVKSATTSRTSRVHGDRERQERLHEEKVPNTQRGFEEVRVHGRVPRMQSSKQRNDCSEPFGGVQKKACGRVGESWG